MKKIFFVLYLKKGEQVELLNCVKEFDKSSYTPEGFKDFLDDVKKQYNVEEAVVINMFKL